MSWIKDIWGDRYASEKPSFIKCPYCGEDKEIDYHEDNNPSGVCKKCITEGLPVAVWREKSCPLCKVDKKVFVDPLANPRGFCEDCLQLGAMG